MSGRRRSGSQHSTEGLAILLDEFSRTGLFFRRVNDAPLTQFQVLGERASATNLVRKLIEKNVEITRTEALGWKHAAPQMIAIPRDFLVVVAVRNAEDWARSMFKRPWHLDPNQQVLNFSAFIRNPWRSIVDRPSDFDQLHPEIAEKVQGEELQFDRHPITGRRFDNLFQMRSVKLASHLGMLNRGCNLMLVKAETVQADPEGFTRWVLETLDLPLKGEAIKGVTRRMGNRFQLSVDPELRGDAPAQMNAEDRDFMRQALDLKLESILGYSYP
ncbi:hypothetical protein TG4357_02563 [Thalassovita gelatinovora]|uniref:Sulfotransferase family protein n=1 Tax=Thalassovita gelatinovora TaxID=53501 RepID=A0A0P1FEW6_THAGE|nr:hypothetical protein [Thalassovita gelatinovora]QIZ79697.1 hypothetical protein HFZ77_03985 [Thalassovita gelatinovora]CUH66679.1 hypothetical protein TG4357_02563 [Thalassovita gelatinovora]SEQ40564.1 hypothetical protein SAMN04488043_10599 [Thalassovita gelatinovora]